MRDPYEVLGVPRTASEADVKKAFRRRAKTLHPDVAKDDPKAPQSFAELNGAYTLLSDPEKRRAFDAGEIDANGEPRMSAFQTFGTGAFRNFRSGRPRAARPPASAGRSRRGADMDFDDIFDRFSTASAEAEKEKGEDVAAALSLSLAEAVHGGSHRVELPNGRMLDVKIPAGVEDGKALRLKAQGSPSVVGGPNGDAIVTVRITPHPLLKQDGGDLRLDLPVTLYEAVMGAKVRAPTLEGPVDLNLPAGSNGGRTLRLRGRGARKPTGERGDLFVALKIMLPEAVEPDLEALMKTWRDEKPYRVRGDEFET